jgi:hypothetical protein
MTDQRPPCDGEALNSPRRYRSFLLSTLFTYGGDR